jgi:glycosyltransferase involved in cell wall biosynthesis
MLSLVLITPARNEAALIEQTLRAVASQTVLPKKWVIVSDGSTDGTDDIVGRYSRDNPWITLLRMPEGRQRSFASKVECFNAGYEAAKGVAFDVIGNLDADITFDDTYLEFLIRRFMDDDRLGVAGTPFVENDNYSTLTHSYEGETHVAGGCQLFRRECFEEIGGYTPVQGGGIDWIAVTTARMKGWKTRSFKEKLFHHYRKLGTGESNTRASLIKHGRKDYYLGGHPLWEMFRVIYHIRQKPYVIGAVFLLYGYLSALLTSMKKPVSKELVVFHRREQMEKLKLILTSMLRLKKVDKFQLRSGD